MTTHGFSRMAVSGWYGLVPALPAGKAGIAWFKYGYLDQSFGYQLGSTAHVLHMHSRKPRARVVIVSGHLGDCIAFGRSGCLGL